MKDTKKLFEAMSGIDEDLLAESEEYAQKKSKQKKIIPFIKYTSRVAAAACAVFLIGVVVTQMPKQMTASNDESPRRMAEDAAWEAPLYGDSAETTQNEASYDKSANMGVGALAEAACEEAQNEEEYKGQTEMEECAPEEKEDYDGPNLATKSSLPEIMKSFSIPGMKKEMNYSTLGEGTIHESRPIGTDTLQAPSWIPERYTYNMGVRAGENIDLDVKFEIQDEMVKKHLKDVVVNTWGTGDDVPSANATGTATNNMLVVAYYVMDDKVEVAGELETLPEVVLDAEEVNVERFEEIIRTNKDAGRTDIPVLNFWVWYQDDTLIYFAGNVTAEEGVEIMNSIQ